MQYRAVIVCKAGKRYLTPRWSGNLETVCSAAERLIGRKGLDVASVRIQRRIAQKKKLRAEERPGV